jgi:prophage regulatory protein
MKTYITPTRNPDPVRVVRHAQVCEKLRISSAKLFEMVARSQFPKPFQLVPGGRAVGWLESDVDRWILERKAAHAD